MKSIKHEILTIWSKVKQLTLLILMMLKNVGVTQCPNSWTSSATAENLLH
jgi:hypothetical protein